MCPYFPASRSPGRVIQSSTSQAIWSETRLLSWSSHPRNKFTVLKSSMIILWTTVLLEVPLSPISKVSSKSQVLCLGTLSVSRTLLNLLCGRFSSLAAHPRRFRCQSHIHECFRFVQSRGPYIRRLHLVFYNRNEYVGASRMELVIGTENIRVMMQEHTAAAWKQLRIFQIFFSAALHLPIDTFRAVLQGARFCPFSAILSSTHLYHSLLCKGSP